MLVGLRRRSGKLDSLPGSPAVRGGLTEPHQPCGLAAVSAPGAVPRSRWRRRGGSPIADPRRARVRSGPRRSPLCFITRRFAPRTMLTGIAFVVAPSIRGRRARRIRGRIYGHEYLGSVELLCLFQNVVDAAHHPERLLGDVVVLPLAYCAEALDRFGHLEVLPRNAGELLGDEEGLREELLDLPGAAHGELVVLTQLVDSEDRDDVLQVLVALQDPLDLARHGVVV